MRDAPVRHDDATEPLVDVRLLRYPLQIGARASDHYAEVVREFALETATGSVAPDSVPALVSGLVSALEDRRARNIEIEAERSAAIARGESQRDFVLRVPPSVVDIGRRLDALLDAADQYSRDGRVLALEPDDDVVAFRRWYLGEIVTQVGGGCPTSWPGDPS